MLISLCIYSFTEPTNSPCTFSLFHSPMILHCCKCWILVNSTQSWCVVMTIPWWEWEWVFRFLNDWLKISISFILTWIRFLVNCSHLKSFKLEIHPGLHMSYPDTIPLSLRHTSSAHSHCTPKAPDSAQGRYCTGRAFMASLPLIYLSLHKETSIYSQPVLRPPPELISLLDQARS